jgi:glycine/D-amino acid oxidase-like deaminating enzyme
MSQTFDVVVIGAGIMGSSAAFQLGQRGLKVALLEKATIGSGPSGKSSAIIRQHYSNELTARMALYSLRVFQNFKEQVAASVALPKPALPPWWPKTWLGWKPTSLYSAGWVSRPSCSRQRLCPKLCPAWRRSISSGPPTNRKVVMRTYLTV